MRLFERVWDAVASRVDRWASTQRGLAEDLAKALDQRDFWQDRCAYLVREVNGLADEIAQLRQEVKSVTLHNAN